MVCQACPTAGAAAPTPTRVYTMFCTTSFRPGHRPPPAQQRRARSSGLSSGALLPVALMGASAAAARPAATQGSTLTCHNGRHHVLGVVVDDLAGAAARSTEVWAAAKSATAHAQPAAAWGANTPPTEYMIRHDFGTATSTQNDACAAHNIPATHLRSAKSGSGMDWFLEGSYSAAQFWGPKSRWHPARGHMAAVAMMRHGRIDLVPAQSMQAGSKEGWLRRWPCWNHQVPSSDEQQPLLLPGTTTKAAPHRCCPTPRSS